MLNGNELYMLKSNKIMLCYVLSSFNSLKSVYKESRFISVLSGFVLREFKIFQYSLGFSLCRFPLGFAVMFINIEVHFSLVIFTCLI